MTPNPSSGSFIDLLSKTTGPSTDYAVSVQVQSAEAAAYPFLYNYPSFTADADTMTGGAPGDATYGTIYSYSAAYAPNGNILAHTDSVMGTWNFTYDAVDRLSTANQTAVSPTVTASQVYAGKYGCWTYDSFGNRTLESFSIVPCNGSNPTPQIKAAYNSANNQITSVSGTTSASYTYDASGNTTYDGINRYWYDAEGQLCAVQRAIGGIITAYVYDAEGARIAKGTLSATPPSYTSTCAALTASGANLTSSAGFTITARYLVDLGGQQVTELNTSSGPLAWAHSNAWSGGRLSATYDGKGLHFALADPLGTKRVQANVLGQVDEQCTSLPFGNDINNPLGASCTTVANSLGTGDDATEHHFTQKERDAESGNDYFFARYYTSALGRFTTPDWSAKEEPVPYAKFGDPQTLNLYAYAGNNPIIHVDPDGHSLQDNMNDQFDKEHGTQYGPQAQAEAQKQKYDSSKRGPEDPSNPGHPLSKNPAVKKASGEAFMKTQNGNAGLGTAEAGFAINYDQSKNAIQIGPMATSVFADGKENQMKIQTIDDKDPGPVHTIAILHTHGNRMAATPSLPDPARGSLGDVASPKPNFVRSQTSLYVTVPGSRDSHPWIDLGTP